MRSIRTLFLIAIFCSFSTTANADEATVHQSLEGPIADEWTGVVSITLRGGMGQCTGTLITPNVVLTAKHCFYRQGPSNDASCPFFTSLIAPIEDYEVVASTMAADAKEVFGVSRLEPFPGRSICGADLAVLVLDRNVPDALATPIAPRIGVPQKGEPIIAVGYGLASSTDDDSHGTRRMNTGEVLCAGFDCSSLNDHEWFGMVSTCAGDSGGPALDADGRLIGVLSRGNHGCSSGIYGRIPIRLLERVITDAAADGDYPFPTWGEFEAPTDDIDFDGVRDELDNCPDVSNGPQQDVDADGVGDACSGRPDGKDDGFGAPDNSVSLDEEAACSASGGQGRPTPAFLIVAVSLLAVLLRNRR